VWKVSVLTFKVKTNYRPKKKKEEERRKKTECFFAGKIIQCPYIRSNLSQSVSNFTRISG